MAILIAARRTTQNIGEMSPQSISEVTGCPSCHKPGMQTFMGAKILKEGVVSLWCLLTLRTPFPEYQHHTPWPLHSQIQWVPVCLLLYKAKGVLDLATSTQISKAGATGATNTQLRQRPAAAVDRCWESPLEY